MTTQQPSRRSFVKQASCGFGSLAMMAMGASGIQAATPDYRVPPRAKRIIFLFMQGGVSQVDSFDYKPALAEYHQQEFAFDDARTIAKQGKHGTKHKLMKSPWEFRPYGQSGKLVSDLFPETASHVDDLCFLHGMHTEGVAHGPSTLFLHCGASNFIRPSIGSWVYYGLGTENEDLPGFVSISPSIGNGGSRNYGTAFLPARFQGTPIGTAGKDQLRLDNMERPADMSPIASSQRELIHRLNRAQLDRRRNLGDLPAIDESYDLAWRMQRVAPELMDLSQESKATQTAYGLDNPKTRGYGRKCLLARRLCEAGVRFIQVTYGDNSANPSWDQHSNIPKHAHHAAAVDQPIAALLADLRQRGLLEDTIVWWGSEFGRTPYAQNNGTGRDHNPVGFTVWLAGGGFRPGFSFGATDEFGFQAIQGKVHMHDLHATLLHQLGINHERLTYRHAGRDFRLTDVYGRITHDVLT
ncbi:MAG: DUF1501 domain-containing protein [Planctomycetota bacterium]